MTYSMFLDDERFPPRTGENWVIVRSSAEAIRTIQICGVPSFISYDHDLGGDDTSIKFIWWIIDEYLEGRIIDFPVHYYVHSQNPIGAANIRALLENFISSEIDYTRD